MARVVNLSELNSYIRNYFDRIGINNLQSAHAGRVRAYFIENLSNIGRFSYRDFEKFGNLSPLENGNDHLNRQDGWQALTEEVSDIDTLTYGTGILYIDGEMEIPPYEDSPGDVIRGDEYSDCDRAGESRIKQLEPEDGTKFEENPGDGGWQNGYEWRLQTYSLESEIVYKEIMASFVDEEIENKPGEPDSDNDADFYWLDNEKQNFPFIVVNSTTPKSVKTFLESWSGVYGPYESIVELALDDWPPKAFGGITYTGGGIPAILDFISPVNEVP